MEEHFDVTQIRNAAALSFLLIDECEIERWGDLLTADITVDWGSFGSWRGRKQILDKMKVLFAGRKRFSSLHTITNLWVDLTGLKTATSRCYLQNIHPGSEQTRDLVNSVGIYAFHWRKVRGTWKIERHCFRSLWPTRMSLDGFPSLATERKGG